MWLQCLYLVKPCAASVVACTFLQLALICGFPCASLSSTRQLRQSTTSTCIQFYRQWQSPSLRECSLAQCCCCCPVLADAASIHGHRPQSNPMASSNPPSLQHHSGKFRRRLLLDLSCSMGLGTAAGMAWWCVAVCVSLSRILADGAFPQVWMARPKE